MSVTAFEDGLYQILIDWLCSVTCIKWFRYHPDHAKVKEQHGMIHIPSYRIKPSSNSRVRQFGADINTAQFCYELIEDQEFTVDLYVFRESGDPINPEQTQITDYKRSASDVIKHVNSLIGLPEATKDLKDSGISLNMSQEINVRMSLEEKTWSYWAEATITANSCRTVSYELNGDNMVYCVELCDGTPVCRQQEEC